MGQSPIHKSSWSCKKVWPHTTEQTVKVKVGKKTAKKHNQALKFDVQQNNELSTNIGNIGPVMFLFHVQVFFHVSWI